MKTSLNNSSYNRKRQRLLSHGSSRPQMIPKKQHYSDNLGNEVINLVSDDDDYVFNNNNNIQYEDNIQDENSSYYINDENNHYLGMSMYNANPHNSNNNNNNDNTNSSPLNQNVFATYNNVLADSNKYNNNGNIYDANNLNILQANNNNNKSRLYHDSKFQFTNESEISLNSNDIAIHDDDDDEYDDDNYTETVVEDYENAFDYGYGLSDQNTENAITHNDTKNSNFNNLNNINSINSRINETVDAVDTDDTDDDGNVTNYDKDHGDVFLNPDDTSYSTFIQHYEKPTQTRHLSFTNPINHIFNKFIKKPNTQPNYIGYSSNNTKQKKRTKSLPQLAYSRLTYSPTLDKTEVSLKIGDVKASLINHYTPNYTTLDNNTINRTNNIRKFSFHNPNNKSSLSSRNTFSSTSKSSATSSYEDQYNLYSKNDMQLIDIKNNSQDESCQEDINCDDDEGYYIVKNDAPFANGRFVIKKLLGQGTFGKVVKAFDYKTNSYVAIKIIKSIKKYREASKIELRVLTMLKKHDPDNKFQCIHLRECFDYRNHICIVTDLLKISLYDFMEKNNFLPFPGSHIQAMAKQLLRSVAFLHDLNLIHTDLKPENILIKDASYFKQPFHKENDPELVYRKILKDPKIYTIDFGSAIFQDEYHSSIISTRHYRAPEIILGVGWSFPCDIWSVGSILIELLTGEALFKTHENEQHLAMMQKVTGEKVDINMVRHCLQLYKPSNRQNFENSRFDTSIVKAFSKKTGSLLFPNSSTDKKLIKEVEQMQLLEDSVGEYTGFKFNMSLSCKDSMKMFKIGSKQKDAYTFWYYYIDLLKQMLIFDPEKRITAKQALNHEWFDFGIMDDGMKNVSTTIS